MKKLDVQIPDWLCDAAKAEWARIVNLPGMPIDNRDVAVLSAYCQNWARWVESEKALAVNGCEIIIRDDKGVVKSVVPSPWIGIGTKAHDRMLKAAALLGLGPERRVTASGASGVASQAGKAGSDAAREWFGDLN